MTVEGQTPAQLLRDMEARNAAIRRYAAAHDKFAEFEQVQLLAGKEAEAIGSGLYAAWCLRACRAELDDPEPKT